MKTQINILFCFFIIGFISCDKHDDDFIKGSNIINVSDDALNYLSDKAILSIQVAENSILILSSKNCDTCYIHPCMSHIPTIEQLSLINDSDFYYEEPTFVEVISLDNHGNFFTSVGNKIYKTNRLGDNELVLETGGFLFNSMVFDKNDNIWLSGYNGMAYWNGNELKVYNTGNSELPTDIIHGLAIDNSGNVWVTLDFKGLLKITGDEWKIISNLEIPGLNEYSYLKYPIVDFENNIWFGVFSSDTNSSILKYDNNIWSYQYPNQNGYGTIIADSEDQIWIINSEYENHTFKKSKLTYLKNSEWINFDVSMIESKILLLNANDKQVFIGTTDGLVVIAR